MYDIRHRTAERAVADAGGDLASKDLSNVDPLGSYINDIELIFGGVGEPEDVETVENDVFNTEHVIQTNGLGTSENSLYIYNTTFNNRTAVLSWVYLEDPAAINALTLEIYSSVGPSVIWSRTLANGLELQDGVAKKGWNLLRWRSGTADTTGFGSVVRIRWLYNTNAITTIKLGPIGVEGMPKSRLMFIIDGAQRGGWDAGSLVTGQSQSGVQDMIDEGIKPTWGITPEKIQLEEPQVLTVSELQALQADPNNDFSFHRYSATNVTSTMTYEEMLEDVWLAQDWLQDKGFGYARMRSGVLQNDGPEAKNMINEGGLRATATGDNLTGALDMFPFRERDNIRRIILHGKTTVELDTIFQELQDEQALLVIYTHAIVEDGAATAGTVDVDVTTWNYFLGKVNAGVVGGWLQCDNYSSLTAEMEAAGLIDYDFDIKAKILKTMQSLCPVKHIVFDSDSVAADAPNESIYKLGGNLFWKDSGGTSTQLN